MHVAAYGGTPRKNEYANFSNCSRGEEVSAELKFFMKARTDEKRNQPFASRARAGENKNERRKTQILDCERRARRA